MLFMNLAGLPRAMWAGIACMSVCLPFTKDCEQRAVPRGLYNIIGCAVFLVLYLLLPENMYPYIGMIGGIGVGYSASYPWQTVFNTFGALSIATTLFGLPYACLLYTSRSQRRHCIVKSCLMHGDHIHVPLADDQIFLSRRTRHIQSVQISALIKDLRLR